MQGRSTPPYPQLYDADKSDITRFLSDVRQNNLVSSTRRKLAPIKEFFKFLQKEGHRSDNPAEAILLPKSPRRSEDLFALSREEIKRLLNAPSNNFKGRDFGIRDRAMLHFLYSGPKRAELPMVSVQDVDIENRHVKLDGHVVPLRKEAAEAIAAYLRVRPKAKSRALFLTFQHNRITPRQVWCTLKKYVRKAGLNEKTSIETLRATFAVHALEDEVYFIDILSGLGNVDATTLLDYAKLVKPRPKPVEGGPSEVLTTVTPFVKFTECARDIRESAVSAVLKYVDGDKDAPVDAKRTLEAHVKRLADNWPSITAQSAFTSLKRHVHFSQIQDYKDILNKDLPALEAAALQTLSVSQQKKDEVGFITLLHARVIQSSLRHYEDGDYREAVLNAMLALTETIREKSGLDGDGVGLASKVFKPEDPVLVFSEVQTISGRDEHEGFHKLMLGAFQGVRNPKSHRSISDLTAQSAAQYLVFISLLIRRVEEATRATAGVTGLRRKAKSSA
jgi:uncharacterized protein (TIGR02391 family)